MNVHELTGLSILATDPLLWPRRAFSKTYGDFINSYSHEISVKGGFLSAACNLVVSKEEIEEWAEKGLGRDLLVSDRGGVVFHGFANEINANIGSLTLKIGPLMDVGNRTMVTYSRVNASGDAPISGGTFETPIVEDATSQERYGIIEKVWSVGQCLREEAEQIRDAYLEDYKEPLSNQDLNLSNPSGIGMTLEILGYGAWLKAYVYNTDATTYVTYDTKIKAALTADPNNIISLDYSNIDENLAIAQSLEDKNRFAEDVIMGLVNSGDASGNRWTFGIYEDRIAHYHQIESELSLQHLITDGRQQIATIHSEPISPWRVRPGKWIRVNDVLPGMSDRASLRQDPRNVYIESVKFDAPYGLTIQGSRVGTVAQYIARLGIGGL